MMKNLLFLLFPILGFAQDYTIDEIRYQENDSTHFSWILNGKLTDYKPVTLTPQEVFYNYVKIQKGKRYKKMYEDCYKVSDSLIGIIDIAKTDVEQYLKEAESLRAEKNGLQEEADKLMYDLGVLRGRKKKFYEKPLFLIGVGVLAGGYIGLQIAK